MLFQIAEPLFQFLFDDWSKENPADDAVEKEAGQDEDGPPPVVLLQEVVAQVAVHEDAHAGAACRDASGDGSLLVEVQANDDDGGDEYHAHPNS